MPQTPYAAQSSVLTTAGGQNSALNVTATTVIKGSAGRVCRLIFNAASTSAPAVYDYAATTGFAAANLVWEGGTTTAAQTVVDLEFPCATGIVLVPSGATVSVSYL